ncbi:UNVERIFIED_CONTAM: hypothetical protein PYX00_009818 [Menopon gallinae]|uniref:Cilia- and flagella-associated protein 44 n=1 Tax=Menopon gallinae TaxID=328185 RepID=A0AAW2HCX2_9NEOP
MDSNTNLEDEEAESLDWLDHLESEMDRSEITATEETEASDEQEDEVDLDAEQEEEEEPEEVTYDPADYISQPVLSDFSTLPVNIVEFDHSFGYECKKLFNLSVIDKVNIIFASGNYIHFLDTTTGKMEFKRSSSGRGIGHIATNPVLPHIAVGEKGDEPDIIIYQWPGLEIVAVLKQGTQRAYSHLNYSPDGELLCSQGSSPDYMLTIWNWRKRRIMLRAKAYGAEVFNARFSLYVPGLLTTSGTGHIKFWKINRTFTGLKLQGEPGRFGKTEMCNVIGFLALPDEKVVSGSEWGNILVWEAGLIRVEVFRRGKNNCHDAPITQFIYSNGEMMTVAMDGSIKVWHYETIELADPPEEEKYIEVEPIYEFEVGDYFHQAELLMIVKSSNLPGNTKWFGQDGRGRIWKLSLTSGPGAEPHEEIYHCHSGRVVAVQGSPVSTQFATLGSDGRLHIYDYTLKKLIFKKEFLFGGRCLLWLPLSVEPSGTLMIGGFEDGTIRMVCVNATEFLQKVPAPNDDYINLVQVSKAHSMAVTIVTVNHAGNVLVTGSEDSTIFIYQVVQGNQFPELVPIGYIPTPGPVSCSCWKPTAIATILIGCTNGEFAEYELPMEPPAEDPASYLIEEVKMKKSAFVSVKGEIMRNFRIEEIIAEKRAKALEAKQKRESREEDEESVTTVEEPVEDVGDDEDFLQTISESELPEIYIPPVPNSILTAIYKPNGNFWLTVAGYDAGYIYEYNFSHKGPIRSVMMENADDVEIHAYHYYHNGKYLILGMQNGQIRVIKVKEDPNYFCDYWTYSTHDNDNGVICQIAFNYDYHYMFTCGSDGNVFSYVFNAEGDEYKVITEEIQPKGFPHKPCVDTDDPNELTLEQHKMKIQNELQQKAANAHKHQVLDMLKNLEKRYEIVQKRNAKLPKTQQLTREELLLDTRVAEDFEKSLEEEMDLVKRKLIWNLEKSSLQYEKLQKYFINPVEHPKLKVYGIQKSDQFVETFRLRALGAEFEEVERFVLIKLEEQELRGRTQARMYSEEEIIEVVTRRPNPAEALLKQIMALCGDYTENIKLRRLLRKYRERKESLETRRIEWHEMMRKKPNPNKPHREDVEAIQAAKENIGDYKLKSSENFKVQPEQKITTVTMYDKLLKTRRRIYQLKKDFNNKVLELRERKVNMIERHQQLRLTLLEIAKEIPKEKIRDPPDLPKTLENVEFPERKFQCTEDDIFDELPKRLKTVYKQTVTKKKELRLLDKEYEMLIMEKKSRKSNKILTKLPLMRYDEITGSHVIEELEATGRDDRTPTPWEKEYRKLRVIRRLFEQDGIIEQMEKDIKKYDNDIYELKEEKCRVEVDVKFLQLYLLTVHQEVLILKKFEAQEEVKENRLFEKLMEKNEIQKRLNEINSRIEARNREVRRCEEEIKNLVTSYYATITDNKFYDYLRRIFKKKYRPPKVKSDDSDSESESESSSSSDEEDAKSIDSKDMAPIRLDESICPPGCDPGLYDLTFKQRAERHMLELAIVEEKRLIEGHKKDYDQLAKKIKKVEVQYNECQNDLEEYVREKQRNLNEVETVVILRMNQIQNLKTEKELEKLSDSIVISAKKLTNLYKRVTELNKETFIEKQRHNKNRQHLMRMKIDVTYMKDVIQKLKTEIDETMIRKFGVKVDIDDIEESLLKRLVADMHSIVLELEKNLKQQQRPLREKLSEREETYANKLQENTERNNLITVLEEERTKLRQTFLRQRTAICEETFEREDVWGQDIERLEKTVKRQEDRICQLKREIQALKLKVAPMPPIVGLYEDEVPEVVQKLMIRGFDGECDEISVEVQNELKDIYDEAQEIANDFRDGIYEKSDMTRMKRLTELFMEKIPKNVRTSLLRRMKDKRMHEILTYESDDHFRYVKDVVREVPAEVFLHFMDLVTEIMETVSAIIIV